MNEPASRNDKGNALLIAVVVSLLIAIATVAIARAHKVSVDASIRETLPSSCDLLVIPRKPQSTLGWPIRLLP